MRPRGATHFAAGLFCFGLEREMIYLGEKLFGVYFASLFPVSLEVFCHPFREENKSACWQDPVAHISLGSARTNLSHQRPRGRQGKGGRHQEPAYTKVTLEKQCSRRIQSSFTNDFNEREMPHRRSREGRRQSAPEPRRPWNVELNPALTPGLGYSLPVPPFLRGSLIFI